MSFLLIGGAIYFFVVSTSAAAGNTGQNLNLGARDVLRSGELFCGGYVMAPRADHDFTEGRDMSGRMLGCVVLCVGLMAGASLQAHHSLAGVYDMKGEKEVSGTLTKILFVNPHGSLHMAVKNAEGGTTEWVFTTGSATTLADRGISKIGPNALKAGEAITAKFIPARNGSPLGFLKSITRADASVLTISAGNPND